MVSEIIWKLKPDVRVGAFKCIMKMDYSQLGKNLQKIVFKMNTNYFAKRFLLEQSK